MSGHRRPDLIVIDEGEPDPDRVAMVLIDLALRNLAREGAEPYEVVEHAPARRAGGKAAGR